MKINAMSSTKEVTIIDHEAILSELEKQAFEKLVNNMPADRRLTINQTIEKLIELPDSFLRLPMNQLVTALIQSS